MKKENVSVLLDSLKWSLTTSLICLVLASASNSNETFLTSWSRSGIPLHELGVMPYRSLLIPIYEHMENNENASNLPFKKYFYAPTGILKHRSAISDFNQVTGKYRMQFEVEMWNDDVKTRVIEHLAYVTEEKIERHQVQVLPFGQVILKITEPSNLFQETSIWLPTTQLTRNITFTLTCLTKKDCDVLAETMIKEPSKFNHFLLLFVPLKTEKRTVNISIMNSMEGDIKTKLLQQFPNQKEAYLKADDLKRLVAETRTHILKKSFSDSEVVLPHSLNAIEKILRDMILSPFKKFDQHEDLIWESVYWNEDYARPDKTSKYLNEVFIRLSQEDQTQVRQELGEKNSIAVGSSPGIQGLAVSGQFEKSTSGRNAEDLAKFKRKFIENEEYVGFDGERFWPKLPVLNTIDLVKLRDPQPVQDQAVNIDYAVAFLSSAINTNDKEAEILASDEWTSLQRTVSVLKKHVDVYESERKNRYIHANTVPENCSDLQLLGHDLNGFYLVYGNNGTVKNVYCNFHLGQEHQHYQSVLGDMDVKSSQVYFYVQKTKTFNQIYTPITFEVTRINSGNAMNAARGIFTAPVDGVYFFSVSGVGENREMEYKDKQYRGLRIELQKNFQRIGNGGIWEEKNQNGTLSENTFSIQSTLQLEKGDKICLVLVGMIHIQLFEMLDKNNQTFHFTHFTGFLLKEKLKKPTFS